MSKSICIKTNNNKIINYLLNSFKNKENFLVSNKQFKIYNNIIIHYVGDNYRHYYNILSNCIYNLILNFFEKDIIRRLINVNYFYFSEFEKNKIVNLCLEIVNSDEFNDDIQNIKKRKKNIIYTSVKNYFSENKSAVLDGFVNFRLKDYHDTLDYATDIAVNKFIIEREYNDFINLLKLYIDTNNSYVDTVHLIYSKKTSLLIDKNKQLIEVNSDILNTKYLSDISFSENDYTLNTLLCLLPKEIHLHLIDEKDEFINTLISIFENRIILCEDCDICRAYKHLKNAVTIQT